MEFTTEQYDIIRSDGDIKVNAVAGSGKTTTLIAYAKSRPRTTRFLYLAFNRSVKKEATRKFLEAGLSNVGVETAHSLAYRHIVFSHHYTVRGQDYSLSELADMLNLHGEEEKHQKYILANHIKKVAAYFCNSAKAKVSDLNYLETVQEAHARTFVSRYYDQIAYGTRVFLGKMDSGAIEITHDFYLKKFQLSRPRLSFDCILFDEGQDASEVMLDVFTQQQAVKVIVGDTHQQIYGWRFAVNSLEKSAFREFSLSTSFRFSQPIADLALQFLEWKKYLGPTSEVHITGQGTAGKVNTRALLARSNLGLLLHAIRYVTEHPGASTLYFEGNISSYTYAAEGASLYDVLNLYNQRHRGIKDPVIRSMRDLDELEEYARQTEDRELSTMLEIVYEYGNEVPELIDAIREKHIEGDFKQDADLIFSTVHRCKGMEYDAVQLADDFLSEDKLLDLKEDDQKEMRISKLIEEINLLYVAVTRAKSVLFLPEKLVPIGFIGSPGIQVLKPGVETGSSGALV